MSSKVRLIFSVVLLCTVGIGMAIVKNRKLGVPLWVSKTTTSWLVEAKVSFLSAEDQPVTIRLALPAAAADESIGQEAGSLGFGFHTDTGSSGVKAVWSARHPGDGSHALYYRVRFPENVKTGGSGEEVAGNPPVAVPPGFSGAIEKAAQVLMRNPAPSPLITIRFSPICFCKFPKKPPLRRCCCCAGTMKMWKRSMRTNYSLSWESTCCKWLESQLDWHTASVSIRMPDHNKLCLWWNTAMARHGR